MTLNSDMSWPSVDDARSRVLDIQKKLHRWTKVDNAKRFDDLFNLVCDRATLVVAWDRVRSNRGSRTAGVDGWTRWHIEHRRGVARFLEETRVSLKARVYQPAPVKEHGIPKAGGKVRYLGIPTIRDRVVQMALKLVLEPIFEVDFCPTSFGYRPARRAQDAIAEIVHFINPPTSYEFIVEGDIKACFDNVHHGVLMQLVRQRIDDRKVLALINALLGSGVMKAGGRLAATLTGTPQGGIISPLLANIYLSALDRHFEHAWQHQTRYIGATTYYRRRGKATYRLVRYADDCAPRRRGKEIARSNGRSFAAREMRAGPSGSGCRTRAQTTGCCSGPMTGVVSETEKAGPTRQVCAVKTNASEPLLKCRKRRDVHRNRAPVVGSGQMRGKPVDRSRGDRHEDGVSTAQALVRNVGTFRLDAKRELQAEDP
jgi:RNA-directed DNA polymerase